MLIEAPYKDGDTISLKLSSGEEVVGKLVSETPDKVILSKPLMLANTPQGVGLAPFMFTVNPDSKITFNAANIITIVKTMDTMSKQYIESTTGIVT